ncbi:MAG: zinc-binding dehydrogenase [Acidobacteria bacterium]|nr:zinc-binding dehydrogenase [Acidobacteriota bacterium]
MSDRLNQTLPATMRALELHSYDSEADSLKLVEKALPRVGHGEVLVRIAAAPVNPSDLMFLRGLYVKKKLPVVAGFEGSGEVVASGGGLLANYLKGKRVACAAPVDGDGTWAEYMLAQANFCVPLLKQTDTEQAASLIVNPFTAWALLEKAGSARAAGVVQTAAASSLGRMIVRLAARRGVPLVNVVRRREQVELLQKEGAHHVLDSSEEDFDERLRELCTQLRVTVGFDAVAGELTGRLLGSMQAGGRVIVYGALSLEGCLIEPRAFIFEKKSVEGFWLSDWLRSQSLFGKITTSRKVQKLLGGELKTEIRERLPLERAREGLQHYLQQMTGGKIIFVPNLPNASSDSIRDTMEKMRNDER